MKRRIFLQTAAAPVVIGLGTVVQVVNAVPEDARSVIAVAIKQIRVRVAKMNVPLNWDLTEVEHIMKQEAKLAGLIDMSDLGRGMDEPWCAACTRSIATRKQVASEPITVDTAWPAGRFRVIRAVNEDTFLPVVGLIMYPSLTEYTSGVTMKVNFVTA